MERRSGASVFVLPHPLLKDAGAFRRSIAAFFSAGPRFRILAVGVTCSSQARPGRLPSASSSRGVIVPPSGASAPPERGGYVVPRPQAPHPLPLPERLMTTPSEGGDRLG